MRLTLFISLILIAANSIGQDTLLLGHTIPEIVFEDEKEERERLFTPQQITSVSAEAVLKSNPSNCLLYTSPSPRDRQKSRMPSSA